MALDLPQSFAVVCHDAGAANLILAWLKAMGEERDYRAVMQGPAAKLWAGMNMPCAKQYDQLEHAIQGATVLLSGTGWASDLEHEARRLARTLGITSIAVIDHWVNYKERFFRQGEIVLPDEIYVTDAYACHEAERCFPNVPIQMKPNLYLEWLVGQIPALETSCGSEVLYALEPIRADWGKSLAGEFQALEYFVANMAKLGIEQDSLIRLRPHPSDVAGKYDKWVASHNELNVVVDDSPSLAAAIGNAGWVVGCETYALVVGLAAGRRVASTLPPWAHRCRLPHSAIMCLRDFE